MKTRKPFSTVWYGSEGFLKGELDRLYRKGDILFYAYVKHNAEEDEKKDHIHVYIDPDGQIDTRSLTDLLTEYDVTNVLPIRPLPFKSSKWSDWYLYNTHNVTYLSMKGQKRKFHYSKEDFVTSNEDYFTELIHTIDMSKINSVEFLRNAALSGVPFEQVVMNGQVPPQQFYGYKQTYMAMLKMATTVQAETIRKTGKTHDKEFQEQEALARARQIDQSRNDPPEDYQTTIDDFLGDDLPF